ncbi:hypothetical protein LXL04_024093 [Taraxacum kok-saghyz]
MGYPLCSTIGRTQTIDLIDKKNPDKVIPVKIWHKGLETNSSRSVSVICDSKQVLGPKTLKKLGEYYFMMTILRFWQATQITHRAGCANVLSTTGNGLGWFTTILIM